MQLDVQTIAGLTGARVTGPATQVVQGAAIDSRKVRLGDLFVCLPGTRVDGHDYALAACEKGAAALLATRDLPEVERSWPDRAILVVPDAQEALIAVARFVRSRFQGTVLGLTGTAGKTTVKEWLASVLGQSGSVARTEGNFNNQLGLPLTICSASGREDCWVIEAGVSHAGDMELLAGILRPSIGIVLNVGTGHTEGLGEKGVAWHKTRMFTLMAPGGEALACADYPDLRARAEEACAESGVPLFLFSAASSCEDFRTRSADPGLACVAWQEGPGLCRVRVRFCEEQREIVLKLPMDGPAAVENCACVALACVRVHKSLQALDRLETGLFSARVPDHRFACTRIGKSVLIDDSYNANPLSMRRMLEAARDMSVREGRPLAVLLGSMGELGSEAARAHRELGAHLASLHPAFVLWKGDWQDEVRQGLGCGIPFAVFAGEEDLEQTFTTLLTGDLRRQGITLLCKGSHSNQLDKAASLCRRLLA